MRSGGVSLLFPTPRFCAGLSRSAANESACTNKNGNRNTQSRRLESKVMVPQSCRKSKTLPRLFLWAKKRRFKSPLRLRSEGAVEGFGAGLDSEWVEEVGG